MPQQPARVEFMSSPTIMALWIGIAVNIGGGGYFLGQLDTRIDTVQAHIQAHSELPGHGQITDQVARLETRQSGLMETINKTSSNTEKVLDGLNNLRVEVGRMGTPTIIQAQASPPQQIMQPAQPQMQQQRPQPAPTYQQPAQQPTQGQTYGAANRAT